MTTVRDHLWIWGHYEGSHNDSWNLERPSRMTPVEGAAYLGVPNLIMVRYNDLPEPPFDQYAIPFRSLDRVVWSIVGASGVTGQEERAHVIDLASQSPNITGVMMDDFFRKADDERGVAVLAPDDLRRVREQLTVAERDLDLWVVLYGHQLELPIREHLALCDKVNFWTWEARDLQHLERDFAIVEDMAPAAGKMLGCYMWDYGQKAPMPLELMQRQCDMGLQWLHEGRIDGMVFLASCICDLELEAVEWTRQWIADVAGQSLSG